jgi:hypothetical protein
MTRLAEPQNPRMEIASGLPFGGAETIGNARQQAVVDRGDDLILGGAGSIFFSRWKLGSCRRYSRRGC